MRAVALYLRCPPSFHPSQLAQRGVHAVTLHPRCNLFWSFPFSVFCGARSRTSRCRTRPTTLSFGELPAVLPPQPTCGSAPLIQNPLFSFEVRIIFLPILRLNLGPCSAVPRCPPAPPADHLHLSRNRLFSFEVHIIFLPIMRLNLGPFPEVPRCPQRAIEEPIPITEDTNRKGIEAPHFYEQHL